MPDAGTVPRRPDVGQRATALPIHLDGAVGQSFDAGIGQELGVGPDPGADHHYIGLVAALVGAHATDPALPQQRLHPLSQVHRDALLTQLGLDVLSDL
ncbi:hypothetical protein D3C79_726180 [compost metagenome]